MGVAASLISRKISPAPNGAAPKEDKKTQMNTWLNMLPPAPRPIRTLSMEDEEAGMNSTIQSINPNAGKPSTLSDTVAWRKRRAQEKKEMIWFKQHRSPSEVGIPPGSPTMPSDQMLEDVMKDTTEGLVGNPANRRAHEFHPPPAAGVGTPSVVSGSTARHTNKTSSSRPSSHHRKGNNPNPKSNDAPSSSRPGNELLGAGGGGMRRSQNSNSADQVNSRRSSQGNSRPASRSHSAPATKSSTISTSRETESHHKRRGSAGGSGGEEKKSGGLGSIRSRLFNSSTNQSSSSGGGARKESGGSSSSKRTRTKR